jgi:hypothetical protein
MPRIPENIDRLKPRTGLPPEVKLIWGELVGAMWITSGQATRR